NFDRQVDADGTLTVTRTPSPSAAGNFVVDVWDDEGAQASTPYRQVSLSLSSADSQVGQAHLFTLSFQGFLPNETVQVSPSDPALFAPLTLLASASGSQFSFGITTNANAAAGAYPVTVRGVT